MTETEFIESLRGLPLHPGALGLGDDAARLAGLVVTTDTLIEGVHFLATDPPWDVAWKLVATNLSDLAAKGARVEGILLNHPLTDDAWDRAFLAGLAEVLAAHGCPLIGGDTVSLLAGMARVLTVTAFGADAAAPPRSGAIAGDVLWVTGTIGDAAAGLALARGLAEGGVRSADEAALLARYRRPVPRLAEGRALAPVVHAMMDVSDGLLIDAARMAAASGLAVHIDLDRVPLSDALRRRGGTAMAAVTAGDDYELLFAAPAGLAPPVAATAIGGFTAGAGLTLAERGIPAPLPATLGWEHGLR